MKRKTSREILVDSFHELAEKKPVNKITIHEIARNCGYSPATFYRQFSDKYDLMVWDYINSCSEIMNQVEENKQSWEETVAQCCRYFYNQRQYVQNLLKNTEGQEAFFNYMTEANAKLLTKIVYENKKGPEKPGDLPLLIRTYCYGMTQALCEWLTGRNACTVEEMESLFVRALPEPLVPYLISNSSL